MTIEKMRQILIQDGYSAVLLQQLSKKEIIRLFILYLFLNSSSDVLR